MKTFKDSIEGTFQTSTTLINYIRGNVVKVEDSKTSDPLKFYELIYDLEKKLKTYTIECQFKRPDQASKYPKSHDNVALIIDPPKLDKGHVIDVAVNGKRLPPKSTRHLTPLKKVAFPDSLNKLL